jgi:CMP-N,N'-diacetyllegionaminic acid synthase
LIKNKKIICIIPARQGSLGLKNKNIKLINGKPLIYWPIKASLNSKYVDYTLVTTNSNQIKKIAKKNGANVPFLRPEKLSTSKSKISNVILHTLKYLKKNKMKFDYFILLEPTSPLTNNLDVDIILKKIVNKKNYDSLVTVVQNITAHPIFNLNLDKNNKIQKYSSKNININRQKISKLYYLSGNAYVSKISTYLKHKSFIQKKTIGHIVDKWKASEIDDIIDFIKTESIMKYGKNK